MNNHDTTLDQFAAWEVEAFLDGEEMPHIAEFLARHPAALATLRQEQARSQRLQRALYRFDCPSPATLQAYLWQELAPNLQQQLATHLQHCTLCSAELASLQTFVSAPLPVTQPTAMLAPAQPTIREQLQTWLDQVQVMVATLVTPSTPQMAGVALRSSATAPLTYLFTANNTDVSLLMHKQLDGAYRIDGQLFAATPLGETRYAFTNAQPDIAPVTGPLTATGSFVVTDLPAGSYQVVLKFPNQALVVPNLTLA